MAYPRQLDHRCGRAPNDHPKSFLLTSASLAFSAHVFWARCIKTCLLTCTKSDNPNKRSIVRLHNLSMCNRSCHHHQDLAPSLFHLPHRHLPSWGGWRGLERYFEGWRGVRKARAAAGWGWRGEAFFAAPTRPRGLERYFEG